VIAGIMAVSIVFPILISPPKPAKAETASTAAVSQRYSGQIVGTSKR
jgi:hypothetical protein